MSQPHINNTYSSYVHDHPLKPESKLKSYNYMKEHTQQL